MLITGPYEAILEEIHERNREDAGADSQEPEAVELPARGNPSKHKEWDRESGVFREGLPLPL